MIRGSSFSCTELEDSLGFRILCNKTNQHKLLPSRQKEVKEKTVYTRQMLRNFQPLHFEGERSTNFEYVRESIESKT